MREPLNALLVATLLVAILVPYRRTCCEEIDWASVVEAARALSADRSWSRLSASDALESRAREVLAELRHPRDRETLKAAVPRLRRSLRRSLGVERLPSPAARELRTIGTLNRGDYVIEKLVYETLPGVYVPAHLYRPAAAGERRPAVLFVPGHWWADSKTRPDFQAFCINMARRGFVVLSYDPFGQGERGVSFRDHRRTAALLAGISQQGIVVFESQCALAILAARPDVDPERIGLTGASGGGYNTWTLAAIDDRIAAAVPVVGTSEFYEQLSVCRPLDWYRAKEHCHFVPGLLRYANNHELLAMVASRPLLVISAKGDESFPLPGIRRVVDYGRALYSTLGSEERLGYFEDASTGHGYQKEKREAAYGWFLRWLKDEGDGRPVGEPPTRTWRYDDPELRCFPAGRNRPAGPGIIEHVTRSLDGLPRGAAAPEVDSLRASLAEVLGIERFLQLTARSLGVRAAPPVRVERLVWESVDGIEVPAFVIVPTEPRGFVVAAADAGAERLLESPALRFAIESGWAVAFTDVRGTGEHAVPERGWTFAVSLLLGESFVGRQALDLAMGRHALTSRFPGKPSGLWGVGPSASLAALYAGVLDREVGWLVTDGGFVTYRSFVDRPESLRASYRLAESRDGAWDRIDREIPHELIPFDALRHFDLPDLFASLGSRPALIVRPIDGDWRPVSEADAVRRLREGRFVWDTRPRVAVGEEAEQKLRQFIEARE